MPRPPRVFEPGGVYHVTAHGIDDGPIFRDDIDRQDFVLRMNRVVRTFTWRVHAACLMTTHYHLLVQIADADLSQAMGTLNGGYSRSFNARHGRRGPVFERRYHAESVARDSHLLGAIRYVALNPVEAGIVEAPQEWQWSTYGQVIGVTRPWPCFQPRTVLALFSSVAMLRQFVEEVPGTSGARH